MMALESESIGLLNNPRPMEKERLEVELEGNLRVQSARELLDTEKKVLFATHSYFGGCI